MKKKVPVQKGKIKIVPTLKTMTRKQEDSDDTKNGNMRKSGQILKKPKLK